MMAAWRSLVYEARVRGEPYDGPDKSFACFWYSRSSVVGVFTDCTVRRTPRPPASWPVRNFLGETECTIKIPKDSEWIQDGRIELTFALPNGQEQMHVVDLSDCEPSNPLAEIVSWPFSAGWRRSDRCQPGFG